MEAIKAIETIYNGYRFRSRLEARWAVFFDACGVNWEYEPEGYDLGDGIYYLPDFLLHDIDGRDGGDLYVEVKGNMTPVDAEKIMRFAKCCGRENKHESAYGKYKNAILVVGNIPKGESIDEINQYILDHAYDGPEPYLFNFETIDGDYFGAHPGVNKEGKFELFGDDYNYLCDQDPVATERAYRLARQARFEHGETPEVRS